ncbi:hypothetical protein, partial [Mycoplasma marinum]
ISEEKKSGSWKYESNIYDNDVILKKIIDDYQNEAGFFFKQIFSMLIEFAQKNKFLDEEAYKKYEENTIKEEGVSTQNRWPDSVANYFISSGSSEKKKHELNEIVDYIINEQ